MDYTAFVFYLHHIDKIYGYSNGNGAVVFAMSYFARLVGVFMLFAFPLFFNNRGAKTTLRLMGFLGLLIAGSALIRSGYIFLPILRLFQGVLYSFAFPVTLISIKNGGKALRLVFAYGALGILISYVLLSLSAHEIIAYKTSFILFFLVFSILSFIASYNYTGISFKDAPLPKEKINKSIFVTIFILSLYSLCTNITFIIFLFLFKKGGNDITYLIIYVLLLFLSSKIRVNNIMLVISSAILSLLLCLPYFGVLSVTTSALVSAPFLIYLVSCLPDRMRSFFSGWKSISFIGVSYGIGAAISGILASIVFNECFDNIFILISILFFLFSVVSFFYGNLRSEH